MAHSPSQALGPASLTVHDVGMSASALQRWVAGYSLRLPQWSALPADPLDGVPHRRGWSPLHLPNVLRVRGAELPIDDGPNGPHSKLGGARAGW